MHLLDPEMQKTKAAMQTIGARLLPVPNALCNARRHSRAWCSLLHEGQSIFMPCRVPAPIGQLTTRKSRTPRLPRPRLPRPRFLQLRHRQPRQVGPALALALRQSSLRQRICAWARPSAMLRDSWPEASAEHATSVLSKAWLGSHRQSYRGSCPTPCPASWPRVVE